MQLVNGSRRKQKDGWTTTIYLSMLCDNLIFLPIAHVQWGGGQMETFSVCLSVCPLHAYMLWYSMSTISQILTVFFQKMKDVGMFLGLNLLHICLKFTVFNVYFKIKVNIIQTYDCWLSCLDPLFYLPQTSFKCFGFPIF